MGLLVDDVLEKLNEMQYGIVHDEEVGSYLFMYENEYGCRNECSGSCDGGCAGSCDTTCHGGCDRTFGYD